MSVRQRLLSHNRSVLLTSRARTILLTTCRHILFIHVILLMPCETSSIAAWSRRECIYRYGSEWSEAA